MSSYCLALPISPPGMFRTSAGVLHPFSLFIPSTYLRSRKSLSCVQSYQAISYQMCFSLFLLVNQQTSAPEWPQGPKPKLRWGWSVVSYPTYSPSPTSQPSILFIMAETVKGRLCLSLKEGTCSCLFSKILDCREPVTLKNF